MTTASRLVLAAVLLAAGTLHFTSTEEFLGQVPTFLPARTPIVLASGVVELLLGAGLLVLRGRRLALLGWVVGAFFVAVFPGNLWQLVDGSDSFGLETDTGRGLRLLFQPVLVAWALSCTGAWRSWRDDSTGGPSRHRGRRMLRRRSGERGGQALGCSITTVLITLSAKVWRLASHSGHR